MPIFSRFGILFRLPLGDELVTFSFPVPNLSLKSFALPFGRLWYDGPKAVANAIGYAQHCSRSHHPVIRVYDDAGNVIETREHKGDFKEP
jgi:hypothetical protein